MKARMGVYGVSELERTYGVASLKKEDTNLGRSLAARYKSCPAAVRQLQTGGSRIIVVCFLGVKVCMDTCLSSGTLR